MRTRRAVVVAFGVILLSASAGCWDDSPSARRQNGLVPQSLEQCVTRWNTASLGTGRGLIVGIAGRGHEALMVRFKDGVCGLVLPSTSTANTPIFFNFLSGDYPSYGNPGGGPRTPHPANNARLKALAEKHVNVLTHDLGRLSALPDSKLLDVPYTVLDTQSACSALSAPPPVSSLRYVIAKRTVNCLWVRTLLFAYLSEQGTAMKSRRPKATVRRILGWQCLGTGRFPPNYGASRSDRRMIRCTKRGTSVVEAHGKSFKVIGG